MTSSDGESSPPRRPKVRLTYIELDKNASAEEIYEYLMERARRDGFLDKLPRPDRGASPGPGRGAQEK